jgi:hypothetical protein
MSDEPSEGAHATDRRSPVGSQAFAKHAGDEHKISEKADLVPLTPD